VGLFQGFLNCGQLLTHLDQPIEYEGIPGVTSGKEPTRPLSMEFFRQEYWSGLPCPSPGDLPNPGIESASLTSPALAGGFFTTSDTWNALIFYGLV